MNERARIAGEYRFADSICISQEDINQEDINQLIMAKAGLRTGCISRVEAARP